MEKYTQGICTFIFLEVLKAVDEALGGLIWWGQPAHSNGWGWMGFEDPSKPTILWS